MSQYHVIGEWDSQGKPLYLTEDEVIDPDYVDRINKSLPELGNVAKHSPQYLTNTASRNIIIKSTDPGFNGADVHVTFIAEGAGYKNVFGYYHYPLNEDYLVPTILDGDTYRPIKYSERNLLGDNKKSILNKTIVFPNASRNGSGGSLIQGNTVRLVYNLEKPEELFPNNTGIGFFLIADGWDSRSRSIKSSDNVVYSDAILNPPTSAEPNGSVQTILLADEDDKDSSTETIVIGMEDILRPGGDADFNDLIVKIKHTANISDISGRLTLAPINPIAENTLAADSTGCYLNFTDDIMVSLNKISTKNFYLHHIFRKTTYKKASLLKTVLEDIDWEYEAAVEFYNDYADEDGQPLGLCVRHLVPKDRLNKFLYLMKAAKNNTKVSRLDPEVRNIVYYQNDYVFDDEIDPEFITVKDDSEKDILNLNGRPNRTRLVYPLAMGDPHFTTIDGRKYTLTDLQGSFALVNNDYLTINTLIDFYPPNIGHPVYNDLTFMKYLFIKYQNKQAVVDLFSPGKYLQLSDGILIPATLDPAFELVEDLPNTKVIRFNTAEMGSITITVKYFLHIGDLVNDISVVSNGLFIQKSRGLLISPHNVTVLPTLDSSLIKA